MPIRPDFFDTQTLAIIRRKVGIRADQATLESELVRDLQCDSLDMIEVAHALEDAFGIEFTDKDIETAETVADYAATARHRVCETYTLPPPLLPMPTPARPPLPTIMTAHQVDQMELARRADAIGWTAHPAIDVITMPGCAPPVGASANHTEPRA